MKKLIAITAVLFLACTTYAQKVKSGSSAPAFELKDSNGKTHKLSDYSGKTVVLEFVNFSCPFVQKHYDSNNMQGLQKKYTEKDVIWLTVCSSADQKPGFMKSDMINKTLKMKSASPSAYLIDNKGTLGKSLGAKTTPHMYIINKDGKIAYQGAIDNKRSTSTADIAKSTNYVSQALDEILAGKKVSKDTTKAYGCGIKY